MQRQSLRLHRLCSHALLLTSGWALFLAGWWSVARHPEAQFGALHLGLVAGAALTGFPLLTHWWVRHNAIHARLANTRRRIPVARPLESQDWNGRRLAMNLDDIRHSHRVSIRIVGHFKQLRDAGHPASVSLPARVVPVPAGGFPPPVLVPALLSLPMCEPPLDIASNDDHTDALVHAPGVMA